MNEELKKIIEECNNLHITEAFLKTDNILNRPKYHNIMLSLSGGADSDTMLDIISKVKPKAKMHYVFFNTGLEYDATKRHLDELEEKYGITIQRIRPEKTIPQAVREFGIPFKSKYLSQNIERCQRHGFKWEDKSYEELAEEYPQIIGMMRWWTNFYKSLPDRKSMHNINYYRMMKEYIIDNPPDFPISNKIIDFF